MQGKRCARNLLRTSCASEARNVFKVAFSFHGCAGNPLRTSCVSKARNAGKVVFCMLIRLPALMVHVHSFSGTECG